MELTALQAFFPSSVTLALTATAPPSLILKIKKYLCMQSSCKIVMASPNRKNLFLSLQKRMPNNYGIRSYAEILRPIAKDLSVLRDAYPMTIIYMGLKYCGYAFQLFSSMLDNHYTGDEFTPVSRLFTQFHAPTTKDMKEKVLTEIKKTDSKIRVIFATTALGMGVDAPNITNIIHITPPANLESYIQEIGRAGRTGQQSFATLFYNNSDIGANRDTVAQEMKSYCIEKGCFRKFILKYFGHISPSQHEMCCSNCTPISEEPSDYVPVKIRSSADEIEDVQSFRCALEQLALSQQNDNDYMYFQCSLLPAVIDRLILNVAFIIDEKDLLHNFGIWEEGLSSAVMSVIEVYALKL